MHIGAGTGPVGPAMAGPFSAEVETKVCVGLLCGLVPRLNYCSKFPAEYVRKCARVRLTLVWLNFQTCLENAMRAPPDC